MKHFSTLVCTWWLLFVFTFLHSSVRIGWWCPAPTRPVLPVLPRHVQPLPAQALSASPGPSSNLSSPCLPALAPAPTCPAPACQPWPKLQPVQTLSASPGPSSNLSRPCLPALALAPTCPAPAWQPCPVGWSDLKKIKSYTFYVVLNCCRNSIPKFHVIMFYFHLSQGLKKIWTVTLKWAKICYIIFNGCTWNKIWRETLKQICFPLYRSKTVLTIFGNFYKILNNF